MPKKRKKVTFKTTSKRDKNREKITHLPAQLTKYFNELCNNMGSSNVGNHETQQHEVNSQRRSDSPEVKQKQLEDESQDTSSILQDKRLQITKGIDMTLKDQNNSIQRVEETSSESSSVGTEIRNHKGISLFVELNGGQNILHNEEEIGNSIMEANIPTDQVDDDLNYKLTGESADTENLSPRRRGTSEKKKKGKEKDTEIEIELPLTRRKGYQNYHNFFYDQRNFLEYKMSEVKKDHTHIKTFNFYQQNRIYSHYGAFCSYKKN